MASKAQVNHAQTTNPENLPGRSHNMDGQNVQATPMTASGTNTPINPGIAGQGSNYGVMYCCDEDMS